MLYKLPVDPTTEIIGEASNRENVSNMQKTSLVDRSKRS